MLPKDYKCYRKIASVTERLQVSPKDYKYYRKITNITERLHMIYFMGADSRSLFYGHFFYIIIDTAKINILETIITKMKNHPTNIMHLNNLVHVIQDGLYSFLHFAQ